MGKIGRKGTTRNGTQLQFGFDHRPKILEISAMKRFVMILAVLAIAWLPVGADARPWKDKSGKYTVEAELVEVVDGQVRLRRADGKIVKLDVAKLSAADQAFLQKAGNGAAGAVDAAPSTAKSATSNSRPAAAPKLDLTFITPDMFAAIILHPQRMAQSPIVAKLVADAPGGDPFAQAEQATGIDPKSMTRMMIVVPAPSANPQDMMPGVVMRFDAPVDAQKIAAMASKEFTEKTEAGKKYFAANSPENPSVFAANPKTIILASEPLLLKMISATGAKSDLTARLAKADMNNDFIAVAAIEKDREAIKGLAASAPVPPGQDPAAAQQAISMLDKIKAATIGFSLSGDTLLSFSVEGNDPATTAELSQQATQMVEAAKAMYPLMTGQFQQGDPSMQQLVAIGGDAVKGLSATTKGSEITVALKRPKDFDQLPDLAKPLIQQAMMSGFGGAPPGVILPQDGAFPPDGDAPAGGIPGLPAPDDAGNKDPGEDLFGK
jgi:hypothetical protein